MLKRTFLAAAFALTTLPILAQEAPAPAVATDSGTIPANGLNMYYEVYGEGEPLVLLHGAFMTVEIMNPLVTLLAQSHQVIVPEMQGHGRTDGLDRPITYPTLADDIAALMDGLGIVQADIVGYSMGGNTALEFAIRHPDKTRKAVVISGVFDAAGYQPELAASLPTMTADWFRGTPVETEFARLSPTPDRFEDFVAKIVELELAPFAIAPETISAIAAPTLLIVGDSDSTTLEHAVEMFRLMGGGKFGDYNGIPPNRLAVLPGTAHVGVMFQPALVADLTLAFLSGVEIPVSF